MNIFIEKLKNIVIAKRNEGVPDYAIINILKEELQYPVLDFVYNNPKYSHLIMYGGTLLRICYKLPRMSEDLDFQSNQKFDFKKFQEDISLFFKKNYAIGIELKLKTEKLTGTNTALINFPNIMESTGIKGNNLWTTLKIRFDVNFFPQASNFSTEMIPVNKDHYAFSIKTYPLSTLMASKIGAVLLRGQRTIETEICDCKPRDIYDLMWYMQQKIIPHLDFLRTVCQAMQKTIETKTVLDVFDELMQKIEKLDDRSFGNDLKPFFYNSLEYTDWHRNWRERFRLLKNSYEIYEAQKTQNEPELIKISIAKETYTGNTYFHFYFAVKDSNKSIHFTCILSEYWFIWNEFKLSAEYQKKEIEAKINGSEKLTETDYAYAGLFYGKITDYIKRNHFVVLQPEFKTKIIRPTGEKLDIKTQVLLDRKLLIKEKFEDLL